MPTEQDDRGDAADGNEIDPLDDPEEAHVLFAALDSFRQYRRAAHYNITHVRRQSLYGLSSDHLPLLTSTPLNIPKTLQAVDEAIDSNALIAEAILRAGLQSFGIDDNSEVWKGHATPNDLDKARSTIRQLYRDWSAEGLPERHAAFTPILKALESYLLVPSQAQRHQRRVLVPGAGLGRLVLEVCAAGWSVEGNEISYHQILASTFVLNHVTTAHEHRLYPWALNFSNYRTRADQLQCVTIPDVQPAVALDTAPASIESEVHHSNRMSMTSGDFCVVYRQDEYASAFDAVATCFFIDTAPNVMKYIETVKHCLQPGGVWINLGPLLWHFEGAPTPAEREKQREHTSSSSGMRTNDQENEGIGEPGSVELTNDEVLQLVSQFGFDLLEQCESQPTGYIQDPASMLQNVYRPVFWVARKR